MVERITLVEKLVLASHLNVSERGMLDPETVSISEVMLIILRTPGSGGRFPNQARRWKPGELVFEGHFFEMLDGGRARLRWQRSAPIDPLKLA